VKKITLDTLSPYEAAGHFGMTAFRLCGKAETGSEKFWVGISYYEPGGGVEYSTTATEKCYFVLDGEITVTTDNEEITLGPREALYIPPNEGRSILNKSDKTASMLVIFNY